MTTVTVFRTNSQPIALGSLVLEPQPERELWQSMLIEVQTWWQQVGMRKMAYGFSNPHYLIIIIMVQSQFKYQGRVQLYLTWLD
jgi:hypothetical protein